MTTQFCKVGNASMRLKNYDVLKDVQNTYKLYIEQAYNLKFSDSSLSDVFYFEAYRLKKQLQNLKRQLL